MGADDHDDPTGFFKKDGFNNMNSKIMISAIASLAFVVVLVVALHIYARCMIRRQSRRRIALQNIQVAVSIEHVVGQQPPKTGLEPAVIASLPSFAFKKADNEETATDCSVCLSLLETDEMVRKLPNCNHTFHVECIDIWLGSHSTCPICRTEAEPAPFIGQLSPEPQDEPTAPPIDGPHVPTIIIGHVADGITSGCVDTEAVQLPTAKVGGSGSRLSSFRRILSRERSFPRVQSRGRDDGLFDPERQHQYP